MTGTTVSRIGETELGDWRGQPSGTATRLSRIICPIDVSEPSAHALAQAVACAQWSGAGLTVLHVTSPMVAGSANLLPPMFERMELNRQEAVGGWVESHLSGTRDAGVHVDILTLPGDPAQVIVACAAELSADLLVLGTRGAAGSSTWCSDRWPRKCCATLRARC